VTDLAVAENPWGVVAVRRGPWKLIESQTGACELYNLDEDPGERANLFPRMSGAQVVNDLREAGFRYLLGAAWDRYRRDIAQVRQAIDAEMSQRGLKELRVDPESWRDTWSGAAPEPLR